MASNLGNVGKDLKHTDHLLDEEKIHHKIGQQQQTNLISDNLSSVVEINDPKQNELTNDADLSPKIKIETPVKKSTSADIDSSDITVTLCRTGNQKSKICSYLQDCKINDIPQDEVKSGIEETQKICSAQTVHKSEITDTQQVCKHKQNELSKTLHDDIDHSKAESADKNGIGVTDGLNQCGNDDKLLFIPSIEDNNSSSVGFDYCENIDLDSTNSTNFSNISQIKGSGDNKVRVGSDETSNNQKNLSCCISVSSNCVSQETGRAVKPNTVSCSPTLDDKRLKDGKVEPQYDLITDKLSNEICDKTIPSAQSLCGKRKSPSVQDRRLKLDALVENIKSLKAAEKKEQSINVDVKDTKSSEICPPQGTISCEKEVSVSVKSEERLDSLHQQVDNNDSNCLKLDLTTNVQENVINVKTVARNVENDGNISTSVPCVNVKCNDDVCHENQQLNLNNSLIKTQGLETNTAKQLNYEPDYNFSKQDEETENNCSDSCGKEEDDHSIDVENKGDVGKSQDQNTTNSDQDGSQVKSESTQGEKQEKTCIDSLEKTEALKQPIFHIDRQNDKKIYALSDVIGNKQPVVCLGERVSKDNALDQSETNKLHKLVKTKKPVKKIEMIRHPSRRMKRVASLNALAMVNILFGKDESPPKSHKPTEKVVPKKDVSSKSLSKAKLILEAKVKCLLKKAKTPQEKDENEGQDHTNIKKEKTSPKKISQIEKSLANLSLDSPPTKLTSEKSPKKQCSPPKSPTKTSTKSPSKTSTSSKGSTKTSPPKSQTKISSSSKASNNSGTTKTKAKDKNKENSEVKKNKKKLDEKQVKGEKNKKSGEKGKKDDKTIKRKNSESDKNKDKVPKPRRKKGELLRSARTHSFHEIKRTKSDIVDNDKVQNSKCSNCQSSWKNDSDKNNYVEGSVQYNMGHVDGGTYSTHSYGVVQSMPGSCVHCSQNGGLYSSQGPLSQSSSFIGGIMGQPGSLVSPCQTFTIGSVPMVQYHHPFGTGYPIQYQSHNTLPHCGCPTCYYYTPTASPLPHHDTCHHSVPPSYTPVRDDLGGVVPPSYSSSHDDLDPDIDVVGGLSPYHTSDHHVSSTGNCVDVDVEIDVVGGVPPVTFNDKAILQTLKKKGRKNSSDSETKSTLDKTKSSKSGNDKTKVSKSNKENKDKCVTKKESEENKSGKKKDKNKLESKKTVKQNSESATDEVKTNKKKSQSQDDVKIGKAKTLSQLAEELRANKKKALSKSSDESKTAKKNTTKLSEDSKTNKKRTLSKSSNVNDQVKKQKLSTSVEEPKVVSKKLSASKRKCVDDVFSSDLKSQPTKQNKTESKKQTFNKSFNRSKSVDANVLKENQCSKSYPKRRRLLSLTRQTSTELITVPRRKSSSSKSTPANKTEKKKVETKKPKKRNHNWEFQSVAEKKKITVAGSQVERECYPAIKHTDGDLIYVRDVVILRSGPRKTDIPYLGKVTAFWEENDEMMMSLLWYYHPEHTDTGRQSHHLPVEIFASKHRDENSIACIDDKGYVLTYNEYCRYRAEKCRVESTLPPRPMIVPVLEDNPRLQRIPPPDVDSNTVYMCRQVYDFKLKRILKNPS